MRIIIRTWMGRGYLFDATLGYPGEGPSPTPQHRRDVRPALRLWSTRRPDRAPVATSIIPAFSPGGQAPVKIQHGNSDTGLGRWLYAARTHQSQDSPQTGHSRRHLPISLPHYVAPTLPSPPQRPKETSSSANDHLTEFNGHADVPGPPISLSTQSGRDPSAVRISPPISLALDAVDEDASELDRRGFIRKYAKRQGVSTTSLEAVWRSNKHGYKVAYDAPFARFQKLFREVKPDSIFSPEHILPGDLVAFLQHERDSGATFASLKDASTSISMACREATDGGIALGDNDSVKRFLKSIRIHEPVGRRKQIVPDYHVAALFQEAWDFGNASVKATLKRS
jgi:hypothetical protein